MRILIWSWVFTFLLVACTPTPTPTEEKAQPEFSQAMGDEFEQKRIEMVEKTIEARDVTDPAVLEAMRTVPRHLFVPPDFIEEAYADHPLPIGFGQTISQPYIVAWMTELLDLKSGEKVLEIGTGSGYQAAVLAKLGGVEVYTIDIDIGKKSAVTSSKWAFKFKINKLTVKFLFGVI